jgi:hypothetical protein
LEVRINGAKVETIKSEGTPAIIYGEQIEIIGDRIELKIDVVQNGINNDFTIYFVTSDEREGWEESIELEEAKISQDAEEKFNLVDPVTMVPI